MSVSREELHRIIEILPEEKLPRLAELLGVVCEEDDEELTEEELEALKLAEQQFAEGDYVSLEELIDELDLEDAKEV